MTGNEMLSHRTQRSTVLAVLLAGSLQPALGVDNAPLSELIPADAMVVLFGRPAPAPQGDGASNTLTRLGQMLTMGRRMGLIPEQSRVLADILGTLPMLGRYPHALALLDIAARPLPNQGYRLAHLQAALVFDTAGDHEAVAARIQALLDAYTVDTHTTLTEVKVKPAAPYVRLIDDRLPEWCVIEWGALDRRFVVTIGRGAFERIASIARNRRRSIAGDAWYARAHERCHGPASSLELVVDFERIERRLSAVVKGRARSVLDRLGIHVARRILWTSGMAGRAITSYVMIAGRDGDQFVPLSDPATYDPNALAAVPDAAETFTILSVPIAQLIRNGRDAYLASQRPRRRDKLRQRWAAFEAEFDFDVETELLDHLGGNLIVHTYPPHPLRVPLLCTLQFEIRDDPKSVRAVMNKLLTAWQQRLEQPKNKLAWVGLRPRLVHADDGVWFIQVGLYGPALAVTDRWIVVSFSPHAVRANLRLLESGASSIAP